MFILPALCINVALCYLGMLNGLFGMLLAFVIAAAGVTLQNDYNLAKLKQKQDDENRHRQAIAQQEYEDRCQARKAERIRHRARVGDHG